MAVDFDKLISDLRARIAATHERLAKLREAKRPHTLEAVSGDAKAKKAIANIDAEVASATAEGETLAMALEEAEHRKVEHEAKAAEDERLRREADARKIAEDIAKASKEADRTAAQLVRWLDTRADLIGRLGQTGVVYSGVLNGLRNPLRIRAALWVAGQVAKGSSSNILDQMSAFINRCKLPSPMSASGGSRRSRAPLRISDYSHEQTFVLTRFHVN